MPYKPNPLLVAGLDYYESGGAGTVTNVSGTANRITVTNPTTTPTIDIASNYVGQNTITTLGTVTTGTWQASAVGTTYGGTGLTSVSGVYGAKLVANNSGALSYDQATGVDIITDYDEFFYDGTTSNYDLPWGNASRSGVTFQAGTAANPGVWSLRTTTNNNDSQAITKGVPDVGNGSGCVVLGGGLIEINWIVQIPTLATAGDDFRCLCGLGQSFSGFGSGNGGSDGVYFYYNTSANANWLCVTRASSTSTTTNSGVAVNTSYNRLTIRVNAAASSVTFYINGTLVATNTTNIPTAAIGHGAQIQKTAGTNARQFNLDRWQYYQQLTTSRF